MPGKQATLFDFPPSKDRTPPASRSEQTMAPVGGGENVVACPMCSAPMDTLGMEDRIRHVEECLTMESIRSDSNVQKEHFAPQSTSTILSRTGTSSLPLSSVKQESAVEIIEISDSESTSTSVSTSVLTSLRGADQVLVINPGKRKKAPRDRMSKRNRKAETPKLKLELGAPQIEKLRYVNSKPTVKQTRESRTAAKSGPADDELLPSSRTTPIPDLKILKFPVSETETYLLSVDAFCYKPHEQIHQYFLSHFHSDHYGGISKRWCRERTIDSKIIYCSVITGRLLAIRYSVEPCHLFAMKNDVRYKVHSFNSSSESVDDSMGGGEISDSKTPGVYVTCIDANHCPGAVIFLFECISVTGQSTFSLHCGDFRVNKSMMTHPKLQEFIVGAGKQLENVYLDTTYMTPKYNFPKQEQVCDSVATLIHEFSNNGELVKEVFGASLQSRITDFLSFGTKPKAKKYLILVGTYLIGKEKLAISISKRLGNSPIYISNVHSRGDKEHIVRSYHDAYLDSVLTSDPVATSDHEVMIHLVPMKIAGNIQELHKYFNHNAYHSHFERCIGLRPTGWSFQGKDEDEDASAQNEPKTEGGEAEEVIEIDENDMSLESTACLLRKQPQYTHLDVVKQNSNKRNGKVDATTYRIYSVPYSEHSSFRELSFFVIFLNIRQVIPTVNTHNPYNANAMAEIILRWETIRRAISGNGSDLPAQVFEAVKGLSLEDF